MQRAVRDELSDDSDDSNDSEAPCAQIKVVRVRRLGSLPAQLTSLSPQVSPQPLPAACPAAISCMAASHRIMLAECLLL